MKTCILQQTIWLILKIMTEIKKEEALGGFPPTEEQLLIRDHYVKGDNIMVDAGAGSSKTSTSVYLSQQDNRSVLYLAFNKAIATEAAKKFPINVTVKTFHALAYAVTGKMYKHKLSRPTGGYVNVAATVSEVQKYYNIQGIPGCNKLRISSLVKDIITKFEHSADREISPKHVPVHKIQEYVRINNSEHDLDTAKLITVSLEYATMLWNDRVDINSKVLCTHDTYLKLYQLTNPILTFKCIIGDEFQDVNPVVADIILKQKCQKILIGDPNQSIYQWRGAKNYLKDMNGFITLYLSKSFRYGQKIADLAMDVIDHRRNLTGFEEKSTKICQIFTNDIYTKIFRTNAGLLIEAAELLANGIKVYFDINKKDFINKIYNVLDLKHDQPERVKHKDIIIFETYDQLKEESEYDPELRKIVGIVENNNCSEIIHALSSYRKPRKPDVIFTTGHKAKGLQWSNVILAEDFIIPINKDGEFYDLPEGEINLLYVCLTRAEDKLQINRAIYEILIERETSGKLKSDVLSAINKGF